MKSSLIFIKFPTTCSVFLTKWQRYTTVVFAAMYQLKQVTVAVLNCTSFHSLWCLMNRKGKSLNKQCFYLNNEMFCSIKSYNTNLNALSALTQPQNRFAIRLLPCRWYFAQKSAQKSAVQVCQVATVVMKTTQLVLSQFENFFYCASGELNKVSLCKKIISERCELVKLCHINCSGPVFWDTVEYSRVFTMMFWCFCGRAVFSWYGTT